MSTVRSISQCMVKDRLFYQHPKIINNLFKVSNNKIIKRTLTEVDSLSSISK